MQRYHFCEIDLAAIRHNVGVMKKPSVLDRLKSERPEYEARQITPPVPERGL